MCFARHPLTLYASDMYLILAFEFSKKENVVFAFIYLFIFFKEIIFT